MSQNENFDQRVAEAVDDSLTVSEVDLLHKVDYNLKFISYVPKHQPVNRSRKRTPWPLDWLSSPRKLPNRTILAYFDVFWPIWP